MPPSAPILISSKNTPHIVGCISAVGLLALMLMMHLAFSWAIAEAENAQPANAANRMFLMFIALLVLIFFCFSLFTFDF